MRTALLSAVLLSTMLARAAQADFIVERGNSTAADVKSSTGDSGGDDIVALRRTQPGAPGGHKIKTVHLTAEGFGNQVPLAFAVRQIVPSTIKVRFGPGADPTSIVNWQGGRLWTHTLKAAVQPLGLHLVMRPMAVEIRR